MRSGILLAVVLGGTSGVVADTLHVPGDFPTIQEAIDAATDGDEVEVHPGTYNEAIDFLGKAIAVLSGGGASVTTIDATGLGRSVIRFMSGEQNQTALDGFTITGGVGETGPYAHRAGGGIKIYNSSPTITNCVIVGNMATFGAGMIIGSDDPSDDDDPTLINCAFIGNTAEFSGGGLSIGSNAATPPIIVHVVNCLFVANTAEIWAGAVSTSISSITNITNSNFWNNYAPSYPTFFGNGELLVTFSNVQDGWPGTGNIDADPLFVDAKGGDFHLSSGSPCIDAADSSAVPEGITTDLDDGPRFLDDAQATNTGIGDCPIVDMGPYEFQMVCLDLDGDNVVGVRDLLLLLAGWGTCEPGDYDGDGNVGESDLLALLANWGPCP